MDKCIIDRRTWLRGEGNSNSFLLRETDNKMCCIGSYAIQILKMSKENIKGIRDFSKFDATQSLDLKCLNNEIYQTNDDKDINDTERESILIKKFAKSLGCELTFIN